MTSLIEKAVTKCCSLFNFKMVLELKLFPFSNVAMEIGWTSGTFRSWFLHMRNALSKNAPESGHKYYVYEQRWSKRSCNPSRSIWVFFFVRICGFMNTDVRVCIHPWPRPVDIWISHVAAGYQQRPGGKSGTSGPGANGTKFFPFSVKRVWLWTSRTKSLWCGMTLTKPYCMSN